MRSKAFVICALLVPRIAAAQSEPPVVQMDNAAARDGQGAPAPQATPLAQQAPTPPPAPQGPSSFGGVAASGDWKFDFHGYFRAPMRIGLGHDDNPAKGQTSNSVHYPLVPDDQYLSWQYTSVQSKDWSELFLSYGNSWVKGTVGLMGFNFTDAAWQQGSAQFGIAQGWLTLTPKLGYQNVRLEAKVGSFWNRYGTSGKYDAGKYDTYLFGRTHAMGEAVRMEIDIDKVTLWAEEGFGVKQPDPNMYNPSKFSLLFHGHGGLSWNRNIALNFHILHAFAKEEDRPVAGGGAAPFAGLPDGSMTIFGPELRVSNTPAGELYVGFSRIAANHATVVTDIVEVIHSGGGQTFSQGIQGNYLDGPTKASNGNGAVNTLLLQYDFSLANLLAFVKTPRETFWGDGPDLAASFFMMFNSISSDDPDMNGVKKIKYGADVLGTPLKWLGIGLRYDRVQPNSKIPEQSFGIVSPRLVFRTAFVTHEEIAFQYSRYLYNERTCPMGDNGLHCVQPPSAPLLPNGFGAPTASLDPNQRGAPNTRPDLNVIKLQASMWW